MDKKQFLTYFGFVVLCMLAAKFIFFSTGLPWLLHALRPIVYVLVLIYLIQPLVTFIQKKTKLKRLGSVVLSFLICLLVIAGFVGMIVPSLIDSVQMVIESVPRDNTQFMHLVDGLPFISYFIDTTSLQAFLNALSTWLISIGENMLNYSSEIITSIKNVVAAFSVIMLSIFMAFFALRDTDHIGPKLEEAIRAFIPKKPADHFFRVLSLLDQAFKKFLIGKLYTCIILGVIVTGLLLIFNLISPWGIKVPYAPLIGFIIGITNIIPYVGPLLGTIPCLLLALMSGLWEGVALLVIILVSQQIDNIFVSPKILGSSVGLGPFWVILSVVVGGSLFGALGMVLFVPLTSVLLKLSGEQIERYRAKNHKSHNHLKV